MYTSNGVRRPSCESDYPHLVDYVIHITPTIDELDTVSAGSVCPSIEMHAKEQICYQTFCMDDKT